MSKTKVTKYLMWDEKSIRERKHRDRGSTVSQMERLIAVLPEEMAFTCRQRSHYPGTNRGDVIGAIKAPNWEESRLLTLYIKYMGVWKIGVPPNHQF